MMRGLLLLTAFSSAPVAAAAAFPASFTGTWVAELDTQSGLGIDHYLVAKGTYTCSSCNPPRSYPADGKLHRIAGSPEPTQESVTVKGPRTIVTRIVEPSIRRVTTMSVASNGRTATYVSIDHRPGISQALKTVYLARRVAPAPKGALAVSGAWQGVRYVSVPELIRTTKLRDDGRHFTYRVPIGVRYDALFGGGFVPIHGPYKNMVAAVERLSPRKVVETRKQDGKVVLVRAFTLSPDGRQLRVESKNPETNSTFTITAHRK
jgi:hypothetical protein